MESIKIDAISMNRLIEQYKTKNKGILRDKDIVSIIKEMNNLIAMNIELGYLDDLKKEINILKDNNNVNVNTIIRYEDALKLELKELTLRIIEVLDNQGLLIVVEPNSNLFIDIDYEKFLVNTSKCSPLNHISMVTALMDIQKIAFVDSNGNLKRDNLDKLHEELLISTDFEKNPDMFKYMLNTLCYLEKFYFIYN